MLLRRDGQIAVLIDAITLLLGESLLDFVRHPKRRRDMKADLDLRIDLVDILAARTAASDKTKVQLIFRNADIVGYFPVTVVLVVVIVSVVRSVSSSGIAAGEMRKR